MNMFKKNGGFTLVELIVVIAILAILAGIAVPAYSGYLKSAEKAGDITTLSAVKTAAVAAMATEGEVTKIEVTVGTDKKISNVSATVTGKDAPVVLFDNADNTKNNEAFMTYMNDDAAATLKFFEGKVEWNTTTNAWGDPTPAESTPDAGSGNTDSGNTDSGNTDSGNTTT